MKTIILASNNQNKIKEISKLLEQFSVEVKSLKELGLGDPVEDGKDFQENSLIKARYAFEKTGLPSLADDSGYCIDSLNNFPGLCSARFSKACGGYPEAFKILNECINPNNTKSHYITCLSFIYKTNNQVIEKVFEGRIDGSFTYPSRGENGFGYDPTFLPDGYNKTFGERPNELRMNINHRARALNKFFEFFKTLQ